ncbi:glycosyltransferase [Halobacteriales archaeon QH_7_65_31]|nr:MAG: glycosyltransferase [Halobacteriales archaeon QH_7_65_31]
MSTKVTLFIGDLSIGGAERVTVNLANQLAENGYQVEVVVVSRQGELVTDLVSDVQFTVLPADRMRWAVIPLIKHLRSSQPDTVISFLTPANIIMILSVKLSMISPQIIVTEHGKKLNEDSVSTQRDLILAKYLYKYADGIVGVSKGVSQDIINWANVDSNKVFTIYNPAISEELITGDSSIPSQLKPQQNNTKIVLSAGRHVEQKDFQTLIRSFAKLRADYSNLQLIILGEGELTAEYKRLSNELGIQENMILPGFVDDPFQYMRYADVFALSSRWEGLSLVLMEAMACGTPVVSTDCPSGPAEVLKNGEYGELVPVGDSEAMQNALKNTLESPLSAEKLRERARDFSIERSTKQYQKLFNNNQSDVHE